MTAPSGSVARAVFVSADLPFPADSGAKLRDWSVLRLLSERMPVKLLTFDPRPLPPDADEWARAIEVVRLARERPSSFRRALAPLRPYVVNGLSQSAGEAIARHAGPGCLAWFSRLALAQYAGFARRAGARVVLDDHNVESDFWLKGALAHPKTWIELPLALQCRYWESRFATEADAVVLASDADRARMLRIAPRARAFTLPNLIDVDGYGGGGAASPRPDGPALFAGTLDYRPNVEGLRWFCGAVLPEYRKLAPSAGLRFQVAGARPSAELRGLLGGAGIELVENPPSMLPLLRDARLVFVPLLSGGGTRLKILEALAAGKPVVSTPIGAEGLGLRDGAELVEAGGDGDAASFARALAAVARDPALASRLSSEGLRAARERFDWRAGRPALGSVLATFSGKGRG